MSPRQFRALPREEQIRLLAFLKVEGELARKAHKRAAEKARREAERGDNR